jgi:hypothetical protein
MEKDIIFQSNALVNYGVTIILNNAVEFEHVAIREQDEAVVTTASRS